MSRDTDALQAQIGRWPLMHAFVVPDTSFYIEHDDKLEEADFQALLGLSGMPVHVPVPIVVVDELDGLKRPGTGTPAGGPPTPWRCWTASRPPRAAGRRPVP